MSSEIVVTIMALDTLDTLEEPRPSESCLLLLAHTCARTRPRRTRPLVQEGDGF